ncbi:transporter [Erythrobacter colymbi]|uniref:transporter n=1 Tax=Erythrobacter colymbi TaxID=1161202 RepID=UPI00138FB393|nr:transporter [Erythrobacter colymbi]
MRRCLAPIWPLALVAAVPAAAQDEVAAVETQADALRDLTTDRPDVTESPFTVDAGHIQIETTLFGYTRSRADSAGVVTDGYEFATTNLRVGVADNLEFDFVWQPYGVADPRGGGRADRGIGSVDLRAKLNLWGNDGAAKAGDTALALLPYVTLPTDRGNGIGNREVAFGLIVPLAIELGGGFGLGLNGAANFSREDGGRAYNASVLTSASLAWEWNERLGSYAEVVWEFSRRGEGDVVTLDTGFTYALGANWQLDAGVNIGASRAADAIAPFVGVSARF